MSTDKPTIIIQPVQCALSGVVLGKLEVTMVEGSLPFLQDFGAAKFTHPFFAQSDYNLLKKYKESLDWFNAMEWYDRPDQVNRLQILMSVVMHRMEGIKQEYPSVPPWPIVAGSASRLFVAAQWYLIQSSKRSNLPIFSTSRANNNLKWENFRYWLDEVFEVRKQWQSKVHQLEHEAEIVRREDALKTVRHGGMKRVDNRKVWNWIAIQLCDHVKIRKLDQYKELFMSGDIDVELWLPEDVDDLVEVIATHCDLGNDIMSYINQRLKAISEHLRSFTSSFTVIGSASTSLDATAREVEAEKQLFAEYDSAVQSLSELPPEPVQADFATLALFIRAQAQWRILKSRFNSLNKRK